MKFSIKKFKLKKADEPEPELKFKKIEEDITQYPELTLDDEEKKYDPISEYTKLQEQYVKNPSEELAKKISYLHKVITNPEEKPLPLVEDKIEIVDKKEEREKERLKKQDDVLKIKLEEEKKEIERLEKEIKEQEEKQLQEEEKRKKEEAEKLQNYINEKLKEQPKIQESRKKWIEKNEKLHEDMVEKFLIFQSSLDEIIPEDKIIDPDDLNKKPIIKIENEIEEEEPELIITMDMQQDAANDAAKVNEDKLNPPKDLSSEMKINWKYLNRERQLEIIEHFKNKDNEQIKKHKNKLFGKNINFSLKKKEIKEANKKPIKENPLLKMFTKKVKILKGVEAYCYVCKHDVQSHENNGESTGCSMCGCLTSVQKILDIAGVKFEFDKKVIDDVSNYNCQCGHREIIHKQYGFCEEKNCNCYDFSPAQ